MRIRVITQSLQNQANVEYGKKSVCSRRGACLKVPLQRGEGFKNANSRNYKEGGGATLRIGTGGYRFS